jgi:hypothetical protein
MKKIKLTRIAPGFYTVDDPNQKNAYYEVSNWFGGWIIQKFIGEHLESESEPVKTLDEARSELYRKLHLGV